jgi:hypothetical protein
VVESDHLVARFEPVESVAPQPKHAARVYVNRGQASPFPVHA